MSGIWKLGSVAKSAVPYLLLLNTFCLAWLPDNGSKLVFKQLSTRAFLGNQTYPDHFIILHHNEHHVLLGGRNRVYNISINTFTEQKQFRIDWSSSDAHSQLCLLKGKSEDDCQNFIRILYETTPGKLIVCGTNSYKPHCRNYIEENGKYISEKEFEGVGICPFNPEHNSTSIFSNGHVFSGTVADFSGGDSLIYREPQRTEQSDLKQLNAPNFVSSVPYGDFIFFFYRETAVEFMNCGKIIYSRVARVCKNDKGGPHQSVNRWTSFLKARLNCSVPGEYPFYFDEIQSTSDIVDGKYGDVASKIIYGTLTTPTNAIGGSAICAYRMEDVLQAFEGSYKDQESLNSNWLPVPDNKVPEPRPGTCVPDSRVLQDKHVNFIKTHSLMEDTVPALHGKPILIRVSLQYRFTAIAVDPQVRNIYGEPYDVLYIGTDDGKVLKAVNIARENSAKAVVISENTVLSHGAAVKQIKIASETGQVIVVGRDEVRLVNLNHCGNVHTCSECVELQDPHCGWDTKQDSCVSMDRVTQTRFIVQDINNGDKNKCSKVPDMTDKKEVQNKEIDDNKIDNSIRTGLDDDDCNEVDGGCAVKSRLVNKANTLQLAIILGVSMFTLLVGVLLGLLLSRRFRCSPQYHANAPFIEQHNHLDKTSVNQNTYFPPRPNKTVNLMNSTCTTPPPKKDNLEVGKDLNITSDGTLQKLQKKTYI